MCWDCSGVQLAWIVQTAPRLATGVFLAKISGTSQFDGLEKTVHNMVYTRGDICLMSKSTLIPISQKGLI
jgi:hypothetical protein